MSDELVVYRQDEKLFFSHKQRRVWKVLHSWLSRKHKTRLKRLAGDKL